MELFAYNTVCINTDQFTVLVPLSPLDGGPIFDQNNSKTMLDVLISESENKIAPEGVIKVSDRADKPVKSAIKAVTWRIIGTIDTMIISYIITGKLTIALSIGSVEVFTKMILYYFHERLWSHIHRLKLKGWMKKNGKQFEVERVN
jgi:uncharacterized membrane protein